MANSNVISALYEVNLLACGYSSINLIADTQTNYIYESRPLLFLIWHTWKNSFVEPDASVPYIMLVCCDKSSTFSIGVSIRSTVRKAAKFAVYDDTRIKVNKYQILAIILVEVVLGATSLPK